MSILHILWSHSGAAPLLSMPSFREAFDVEPKKYLASSSTPSV